MGSLLRSESPPQGQMGAMEAVRPVLPFGAWQRKWNGDVMQKLTSETSRVVRLIIHLGKKAALG